MRRNAPVRSEGSVMLRRAAGTQWEKARKLGVNQRTVSRWESGMSRPRSFEDRDACRRVYGIPFEARMRAAPISDAAAMATA
ncbi:MULTISPECIES: helix-turn-helix transcriptional regulator [Sorangium]|nr:MULTISPECIES: helix-turn-helix transcriptional regulator [Sorangium]